MVLGHDPGWVPDDAERTVWEEFCSCEPGDHPPLEVYIRRFFSKLRTVRLDPFLLEVAPWRVGVRVLSPDDPLFNSPASPISFFRVSGTDARDGRWNH